MKKTLALVLAVLMLCSVVVIATSAEEATDWEALYAKYGVNIYIGAPTDTPPVLDGTISTGEYTFERELEYSNLWESAPGEIQSGVKECYAHDANYIYYASTFTQKNDNRAFWVQWKPTNTFDVFRDDSDLLTYYYNRISLQLRWKEVDGVFGLQPHGSWSWTRPETPIAFPTNGFASDEGEFEFEYAASKITDEAAGVYTKTYEIRIAKSYIAAAAQCSVADVRVVPYWVSFHANLTNAAPLSTDLVIEITETDFTTYVPGDKYMFWFLVCDEAPEGYEPSKGQTTAPTTTETPTTEGAGTTAPATTAAPTTAATTTAAPTTTAKATTAAATTAATTAAEEGGCKGSIAITALAVLPTLAGGALLLKRRKED